MKNIVIKIKLKINKEKNVDIYLHTVFMVCCAFPRFVVRWRAARDMAMHLMASYHEIKENAEKRNIALVHWKYN